MNENELPVDAGSTEEPFRERLRRAERRIFDHPGYKEYRELEALERSVSGVLIPNLKELLSLLDAAATNEELAIELIQNVREPVVRERFHAATTQRLHNYLASAQSLIDHVRRLMRGRVGPIVEEFERRKAEVLENPEVPFVVDLRNFTLHRTLPFFAHRLSMTKVNTPEQAMESEVELAVGQLLEWDNWSKPSRKYLESQGETVVLRTVIKKHGELVISLNGWLHNELSGANDSALEEVNRLVVEANAIFTGGDLDEAEQLAKRFMSPGPPA